VKGTSVALNVEQVHIHVSV